MLRLIIFAGKECMSVECWMVIDDLNYRVEINNSDNNDDNNDNLLTTTIYFQICLNKFIFTLNRNENVNFNREY